MPRGPGHGPRHPSAPPARPAAEEWRDSGDPLLQKDREGGFDAMKQLAARMQARNGVVMKEAQEKQHAERLMKVADWWKQKFPLKTKIAIGTLLGAAGIASFAVPAMAGMATVAGVGALTWRGISTGMTGLLSGLGTFGYLKKRNYSPTVARRAGIFAGALGGVVSFLGGRMLGEYFADKFATGGKITSDPTVRPASLYGHDPAAVARGVDTLNPKWPKGVTDNGYAVPSGLPDDYRIINKSPILPEPEKVPDATSKKIPLSAIGGMPDMSPIITDRDTLTDVLSQALFPGPNSILAEFELPEAAEQQVYKIINHVFSNRHDLAYDFFGLNQYSSPEVLEKFDVMMRGAATKGIRFPFNAQLNMDVLGSEEFLTQFYTTASTPQYSILSKALEEDGGVSALIDTLRLNFRRA